MSRNEACFENLRSQKLKRNEKNTYGYQTFLQD